MTDWIGWVATGLFLASYGCKDPRRLRLMQAAAALLWVVYGAVIDAVPIIVANLLVAAVAAYSSLSFLFRRERMVSADPVAPVRTAAAPDLSRIS